MTLLAALVLSSASTLPAATVAETERQKQIRSIITHRTETNGYEEYLDAAYLAAGQELKDIAAYIESWAKKKTPPEETARPSKLARAVTLLDAYRVARKEAEPALRLIERGNGKPVRYPNEQNALTLQPEIEAFRIIANIIRFAAISDFAEGRGAQASERLISGIRFARNIEVGDNFTIYSSRRVEVAMHSVVDEFGPLISVGFAAQVAALRNDVVPFKRALDMKVVSARWAWEDFFRTPREYVPKSEGERVNELAKGISIERRSYIFEKALSFLETDARLERSKLDEPEKTWFEEVQTTQPDATSFGLTTDELSVYNAFLGAAGVLSLLNGQRMFLPMFADMRIRRRILQHTASVIEYRWRYGDLPSTLGAVCGGKEPVDPATGGPYKYSRSGASFKITLEVKDYGVIGLSRGVQDIPGGITPP